MSPPLDDVDPADRVTLDFSGPPLSLPGEDDSADEACGRADEGNAALDLDLSDLDGPTGPVEHDAWARDRIDRGSGLHPAVPPRRSSAPPPALAGGSTANALGLVERSRPSQPDLDLAAEMADRYALGDFSGSLRAAELLLGMNPDNEEAEQYAASSRDRLVQLYTSRLGALDRIPRVAVPDSEVRWLGLDHKAGFMLSRIDGQHTLEEILDISGMPRIEALKMLVELLDAGAIR